MFCQGIQKMNNAVFFSDYVTTPTSQKHSTSGHRKILLPVANLTTETTSIDSIN